MHALISDPAATAGRDIAEIAPGILVETIEPESYKEHRHFRGSLPASNGIESGFSTGPHTVVYTEDGFVDLRAGVTLHKGRALRQTLVVTKHLASYGTVAADELALANRTDADTISLPLASHRMANYYHWWVDSVSKWFVCNKSQLFRSHMRGSVLQIVTPKPRKAFHRQTTGFLNRKSLISTNRTDRLIRGRTINTSGIAFGAAQRVGHLTREFPEFLDLVFPATTTAPREGGGELLYVSRNESRTRRIVNEEELTPLLRDMGFRILQPAGLNLEQQIAAYRAARLIVSVHGAGLTNMLFCRPGTSIVEIFPEGGVHPSCFFRIGSHLDFDYYHVVGEAVSNRMSAGNATNADVKIDGDSFLAFLKDVVAATGAKAAEPVRGRGANRRS